MRSIYPKLLLAGGLLLSSLPAHADTFGDVNGDGKFDVGDVTTTLQISVNLIQATPAQKRAADVAPLNAQGVFGDKQVNVSDAARMLQKIVGIDQTPNWPGDRSVNDEEPAPIGGVPLPTTKTLSVRADTAQNFNLSGGFKLQGTVAGATEMDTVTFVDKAQNITVSSDFEDGKYLVGVPAGNYETYYTKTTQSGGFFATVTVHIPVNLTIPVSADTTKDFAAPAMPQTFPVQGTITPPAGVEAPFSFNIEQIKNANGSDLNGVPAANAGLFTLDGTYTADLPAGIYKATFFLTEQGITSVNAVETITVVGPTTQNLTAPQLFSLSGPVTMAGGGALPAGTNALSITQTLVGGNFSSAPVTGGAYGTQLPNGTFNLSFSHRTGNGLNADAFSYKVGDVTVQGDTTKAIVVPAFPTARVKLSGKAVGPDGGAITKGSVTISGSKLDNADPNLSFFRSIDLSATGTFEANVPPGDYWVMISPDPGFPVTNKFENQ